MSTITLTTDFGTRDYYVAAMKGEILSIDPGAKIIDISHHITPQNILEGAITLAHAAKHFPLRTVHVGVVDPGVGGSRRAIVIHTERFYYVGPDNGLFSLALKDENLLGIFEIRDEKYMADRVSDTFHGRDIFAPVAAHIARGANPAIMGPPINDPVELVMPEVEKRDGTLIGEVIHIDSFGNLITNISRDDIRSLGQDASLRVLILENVIDRISTIYEGEGQKFIALFGSFSLLEIAVPNKNASKELKAETGITVKVERL